MRTAAGAAYVAINGASLGEFASLAGVHLDEAFSVGTDTPELGDVDEARRRRWMLAMPTWRIKRSTRFLGVTRRTPWPRRSSAWTRDEPYERRFIDQTSTMVLDR